MQFGRRRFLQLTGGALAAPFVSRAAVAQGYPNRPVKFLCGFPPGSGPDIISRLLGQALSERLGQQFVVDNRPGAASSIAIEAAVNSPPDGYTVIMVVLTNVLNATLYPKLSFDFFKDIAPVAGIADAPYLMMVNPAVPAKNVAEFVAHAKANPGKMNYASGGNGSANHVFTELFRMLSKVDLVHVPYRQNYMPDLLSGQTQVVIAPMPQAIAFLRSGETRVLGVSTAKRLEWLPDMPLISETVTGYEATGWYGLGAPRNMPPEIVKTLNGAMNAALAEEKMKERLRMLGVLPLPMSADGFGKFIADEHTKWSGVIKSAGIKVN